jgi:hypothetical protein
MPVGNAFQTRFRDPIGIDRPSVWKIERMAALVVVLNHERVGTERNKRRF